MDVISIGFLAFAGFCALVGFLHGIKKGAARAFFRLLVVAGCAVGAFFALDFAINYAMTVPVGEYANLEEMIVSLLPAELASATDILMPIVIIILRIVGFMVLFFALWLATKIVCLLFSWMLPKGAGLIGGLFGLVEGAVFALVFIIPLNGLLPDVQKLSTVELDGNRPLAMLDVVDFDGYLASPVHTYLDQYTKEPVYDKIAQTTKEDGSVVTIGGQVNALVGAAKMADQVTALSEIDLSGGITTESVADIKDMCANLDAILADMGEEALETVSAAISTVAESFDLPIDISGINFAEVNFTNEASLLEDVLDFQNGETEEINITETIEKLADSNLILPVLETMVDDITVELDDDQKQDVEAALANVDAEKAETLRKLFGLNAD